MHDRVPVVRVPVLSTAMVEQRVKASKTLLSLSRMPLQDEQVLRKALGC